MTIWLADPGAPQRPPPLADFAPSMPALAPFRAAVSDLVAEIGQCTPADADGVEHILGKRLGEEEFATVLEATPDGWDATVAKLLFEVRNFEPSTRNGTSTIASLIRISILAQIEAVWWGRAASYQKDSDVRTSAELVDLDELDRSGRLTFRYRHQASTLLTRAARSAERRTRPGRTPRTAGLALAKARPQTVDWLNQLADEFARVAPPGTPPLWVTGVTRSVAHQQHLKSLGYITVLPSSHCVGYAADIEMTWYRRFHAHRLLRGLMLDRQRAGEVNVIDEGRAWHVCLSPAAVAGPCQIPRPRSGA